VSVENESVVDIISIDEKRSAVILTVSDHLDWSDTTQHQMLLQTKLNRYLAFVESGEMLERYPDGKGLPVRLKVVFKFKPDAGGLEFLSKAKQIVEAAGFTLETTVFAESYDN
jgi:hypothetical protein